MKMFITITWVAVYVAVFHIGSSHCAVKVLRDLGKMKIQPLYMNVSIDEAQQFSTYYGRFRGPSDSVYGPVYDFCEDDLQLLKFAKVSDSGTFSEFEVIMRLQVYGGTCWFSIKSASASETYTLFLYPSHTFVLEKKLSLQNRTQTEFMESSCKIEVTSSNTDEVTIRYTAAVHDCGQETEVLNSKYFDILINKNGKTKEISGLYNEAGRNYFNYVSTSEKFAFASENSYAIFNEGNMAADGVKIDGFNFTMMIHDFPKADYYPVSVTRIWTFTII
ncbi:uncharacterized protein LOC133203952 [Saccostrea echinata]|uniref:uncharacterized protein LOC133203952 n=1 Tax=Saccostrea echinata TaxID=191078 RepID=UPI002A83330C|nr:uncharacterized protein LOC133203952 [Saccostrea echinata]